MIAYKGFTKDMTCIMGKGTYQFEIGKKAVESEAKCMKNGLHCCEFPLDILRYYSGGNSRYCIVRAEGDINEDGDHRISCTELTPMKEISLVQLAAHACDFIIKHPARDCKYRVKTDTGECREEEAFVIVRGKNPKAKGEIGTALFLLQEYKSSNEIKRLCLISVDGKKYTADRYYSVNDAEV